MWCTNAHTPTGVCNLVQLKKGVTHMNYCKNLRVRRKKGQIYFFCVHRKAVVERNCYLGCIDRENKKTPKIAVKTRIKPISKKRVFVSRKTYCTVYERSKDIFGVPRCQYCGNADNLQLHHIYYRSERKDLIDDPDNCIMLCHRDFSNNKCHRLVHSNKKKYQPILIDKMKEILKYQKQKED